MKDTKSKTSFDFNYWLKLAQHNPEAFEQERQQVVDKYIDNIKDADVQTRMRCLQWKIDTERKLAKNPMDSATRIYDMMWESLSNNLEALQELSQELSDLLVDPKNLTTAPKQSTRKTYTATIIPFKERSAKIN